MIVPKDHTSGMTASGDALKGMQQSFGLDGLEGLGE